MRTSDVISEIAGALVLANPELHNPAKDAKGQVRGNPRYTYASLPAILDEVRPVLAKNGIAVVQEDVTTSEGIGVVTRLLHVSGQWLEFGPLLMPSSNDAQANGSILTYCRRYQLTAALGLAPDEDDDGRSAATSPAVAATGGSTANANRGAHPDAKSAQAARDAAPPLPSTDETQSERKLRDRQAEPGVPAGGEATATFGEGASDQTTPAGTPKYLNRDDQALMRQQYGGNLAALNAYKARFGERITRLGDITYDMRDQMEASK